MAQTQFGEVIQFFKDLGIYEVVLPFLLVFTIVFAVLEKTKVFGTEKGPDDTEWTKKNLNAMTAFVIAFLVVASSKLVATINEAMANVVLLILVGVMFMVLISVFYSEGPIDLDDGWKTFFMFFMFIGLLFIFLHAIKIDSDLPYCNDYEQGNCPWIVHAWSYVVQHWDSNAVGSIVLILVIIGFMLYVMQENPPRSKKKDG